MKRNLSFKIHSLDTCGIYDFLVVYLILLFFSGFYFFEHMTAVGTLVVGGLLLTKSRSKIVINMRQAKTLILLLLNIALTEIVASVIFKQNIEINAVLAAMAFLIIAMYTLKLLGMERIIQSYVNCMFAIATVSFVLYLVCLIDFSLVTWLPKLISTTRREGYFAVFSIVSNFRSVGSQRSQGIFWEPGAYQFFLCLAYIVEFKTNRRKPALLLFLISIVTTFSTTGFIVLVLLLVYTVSYRKEKGVFIRGLLITGVMIVLLTNILSQLTGYWKFAIVDKISLILNFKPGDDNASSVRVNSVINSLRMFLDSPVLGIGNVGMSIMGYGTCTPVNWLVEYGIIYGMACYCGLWKAFRKLAKDRFETTVLLGIFLVSVASEAMTFNVIIMSFIFYGLTQERSRYAAPTYRRYEIL